jgi:tRNA A37 methylthiotransferase MiaB
MAGHVQERTRKARAAELLTLGTAAKTRFARTSLGTTTRVLLEQRLHDGRWVGHAEDHVPVAISPRPGDPDDLENAIVLAHRVAVDPEAADRVRGEIIDIDPAPRRLRGQIPVLAGSPQAVASSTRLRTWSAATSESIDA